MDNARDFNLVWHTALYIKISYNIGQLLMSLITRDYNKFVTTTIRDTHVRYQPLSISTMEYILRLRLHSKKGGCDMGLVKISIS
jgi:hypothetical protein